MLSDERSIKRQLHRELTFTPPYCPRPECEFHAFGSTGFWQKHGIKTLKRFPYASVRFRCKACDKTFSASFFTLNYRQKIFGLNQKIFRFHNLGISKREIGRIISISEASVRLRIIRMSRLGLLIHAKAQENLLISEPIVYDGLENFSFSQYDPNNLNHAVGKNSLFTYDFNLCPINRKGMMSPRQRLKKKILENRYGSYPKNAIRSSTKAIFQRLLERCPRNQMLTLYTDRHYDYQRVVAWDLPPKRIEHIRISSKIARNFKNKLFAVNNIDMQARHNLAAFKRETIAFAKHPQAMLENFVLYMLYRNYMRPKFWGTHRSDPQSAKKSPAMELGIRKKIQSFEDFFSVRILPSHTLLHKEWKNLYYRTYPLSRQKIRMAN